MPDQTQQRSLANRLPGWLVDLLVLVGLFALSAHISLRYTHGDLWLDEADYAVAGLHSVHDNRWDISDKPDQPDLLIRLRHFHAPATALILRMAHRFGSDEQTLREPFVAAGALTVCMVYLCAMALFRSRREVAAACALLVTITPANIRMSSHAVPWAFITLELLGLLLAVLLLIRSDNRLAPLYTGLALGLLFVTSEVFFVAVAAVAAVLVFVRGPAIWRRVSGARAEARGLYIRSVLAGPAIGLCAFAIVALIVWPAGLRGHCITMLKHYIQMRTSDAFPVNIGAHVYKSAPKWAYLYWYWTYYRPFLLCYAAGMAAAVVLASTLYTRAAHSRPIEARYGSEPPSTGSASQANASEEDRNLPESPVRQAAPGAAVLAIFTVVLLAAAHRAHIIGAEYLAHCLPFMTLCAGFVLYVIGLKHRAISAAAIALAAVVFIRWSPSQILPGMDERTQVPRWQQAAKAISAEWRPKDRLLLGPQSPNVAYWYLHECAGVPLYDWQIGQFALAGPGSNFLHNMSAGKYRWVVVSSQFTDNIINAVDPRSMQILTGWQLYLVSDEKGAGPPRLTVFRCPVSMFE